MTIVLDASVALSWLLKDTSSKDARYAFGVLNALRAGDTQCRVPVTFGLEVANVIARGEATRQVTEAQSEAFLEMLADLAVDTDAASAGQSLSTTLQLARRYKLSAGCLDQIFLAVGDRQKSLAVDIADVSGFEPAILKGSLRFIGAIPISGKN